MAWDRFGHKKNREFYDPFPLSHGNLFPSPPTKIIEAARELDGKRMSVKDAESALSGLLEEGMSLYPNTDKGHLYLEVRFDGQSYHAGHIFILVKFRKIE